MVGLLLVISGQVIRWSGDQGIGKPFLITATATAAAAICIAENATSSIK